MLPAMRVTAPVWPEEWRHDGVRALACSLPQAIVIDLVGEQLGGKRPIPSRRVRLANFSAGLPRTHSSPYDYRMPLEHFHPLVQQWFAEQFAAPTDPQVRGWPSISA